MPESRYEVLALFAGAMVAASLFVVSTGTLIPFLESAFALPQSQLGFVLSIQMVGSLLATAVAGALTDRFGDKVVVAWSGWFMGFALIGASLVHNFTWLLAWLMLAGIGYAAVTPAGSHAIVFFFKKEDRGFAMGIRQCGVPAAGIIGSILLPAIAMRLNYQWAIATAGVATIVASSVASALYREPVELRGERTSLTAMFAEMVQMARDVRLILMTLTSMALVCVQMVLMAFLTLTLVHQAHLDVPTAVAMFTVSQVAAAGGRLSWGWISDRIFRGSRALPLAVVCIVTAIVAFGVAAITPQFSPAMLAVLAVVLGFAAEGWFGVAVIAFAEIGGEEHSGSALGVALTWVFFAAFVAPTLFGALVEVHGYPFAWRALGIFAFAGIVPALLASAMMRRFALREAA